MNTRQRFNTFTLILCLAGSASRAAALPALDLAISESPDGPFNPPADTLIDVTFPCERNLYLQSPDVSSFDALQFSVAVPTNAPPVEAMVFLRDRDGHWFQKLHPHPLAAGETNRFQVAFGPYARGWQAIHHHGAWHYRTRLNPQKMGLRFFSREPWAGSLKIQSARGLQPTDPDETPPRIHSLRANAPRVGLRQRFELRFELPDRYANPFDPDEIDVFAEIILPDETTHTVHAFYFQDFYRITNDFRDIFIPQGRPHWRLRYSPRQTGEHRLLLKAVDRFGADTHTPVRFIAEPAPAGPPFIRVSQHDPRFFEGCDDSPFFPIGHNIRSPHDERMDKQFPWRFRHSAGSRDYDGFFRKMRSAGENLVEIWLSAWSLGLEWIPNAPGYHGVGDYNLIHAWEMDQVLEQAQANDLYINLVLNNHGRLSAWCDPEWNLNPMNAQNGGYLENPMDYFDDPRAIRDVKQQLRYIVARWGFAPNIFAWELWSELDLIGTSGGQRPQPQHDPRVLQWHATMGDYLKAIDPNRHLVCTHISQDYRRLSPDLIRVEPMDFTALDAYHNNRNPIHIASLLRDTAAVGNPFGKPVLVTEFGGSPMAGDLDHLRNELRVALWTSAASGLAGTPLFWWWHVIDEFDLYPEFYSLSRFMSGEDRRDPELRPITLRLRDAQNQDVPASRVDTTVMASPTQAFAYLAAQQAFQQNSPPEASLPEFSGLQVSLAMPEGAVYRITLWSPGQTEALKRMDERVSHGRLVFTLPPFRRDLAFKLHRIDPLEPPSEDPESPQQDQES